MPQARPEPKSPKTNSLSADEPRRLPTRSGAKSDDVAGAWLDERRTKANS